MSAADVMADEAERLRRAATVAVAGLPLPGGAPDATVTALQAAFAPRRLPEELLALLRVLDGTPHGVSLLLGQPALLSADTIAAQTARRSGDETWCPDWVVVTSEGWDFACVLASDSARDRSPVVDLSYGSPHYEVVAASLTALVAASADAWELGVHERLLDSEQFGRTHADRHRLLARRSAEFPSGDGLTTGDAIAPWRQAWPRSWSGRDLPDDGLGERVPLSDAVPTRGGGSLVEVDVLEVDGRWLHVEDVTGRAWAHLPPGLSPAAPPRAGDPVTLIVSETNPLHPLPDAPGDQPVLRVIGVVDA